MNKKWLYIILTLISLLSMIICMKTTLNMWWLLASIAGVFFFGGGAVEYKRQK